MAKVETFEKYPRIVIPANTLKGTRVGIQKALK